MRIGSTILVVSSSFDREFEATVCESSEYDFSSVI